MAFQRLLPALWATLSLATLVNPVPTAHAAFFVCPAPCEAKLLPRDMESLEDCVCHDNASKSHDNNYDETPHRAGLFRCPEGSAAKMLHPLSFADCSCLSGFTRDDTHKTCSPEDFRCLGRYQRKADIDKAESIADCDCQAPYTKDEASGERALRECPRAGNYVEKSRHRPINSLSDCKCMDPFVKNDQLGEYLVSEKFQCPPHSSAAKNTRPKSFADCHCAWGYVKNAMDECVRESPAYICPRDSMKRKDIPIDVRPRGFFDCECVQTGVLYSCNEFMQSCDEIKKDGGGTTQQEQQEPFACPPFSKPLAAIPHSVEQCACLGGYGWKTSKMVCVRMSTFTCPLHSFKFPKDKHVEETFDDCQCANGYYRDESLQKCIEWFLTNDNGCPKNAFLKHWLLQSKANCQCIYGFKEETVEDGDVEELPEGNSDNGDEDKTSTNKALLRQQRRSKQQKTKKPAAPECNASPSMTMDGKFTFFECPANAFATNWPLTSLDECACLYGFDVAPISEQDLLHGDGELFQCLPSDEVDAEEQAIACRPPMVMSKYNGLCRLPLEEVKPSASAGAQGEGTVQFKGIEYDYVLADDTVMVTQGDIAIGKLLTWNTSAIEGMTKDEQSVHVLHGYYNAERDHRWQDAEMCFQVDVSARMFDKMMREAMAHVMSVTGFKFAACKGNSCRDDPKCAHDFVNVKSTRSSCYAYIGRIGGEQPLGVSSQCGLGNVIHVLLHTVGLHHTIDRVDRDDHVRIAWECIPESKRSNFVIELDAADATAPGAGDGVTITSLSQDVPYDFFSIIQHPSDAFVHSGVSTAAATGNNKDPPQWCQSVFPIIADEDERLDVLGTMGQRELLAVTDIHAVWKLYPALQEQEKPPTYETAAAAAGQETNNVQKDVFESRLHTQEDVMDAKADASSKKAGQRGASRFSQRAASFISAIVTLFGFGAFVAFAVAELKKRGLRGKDAYYTESLLTDKSLTHLFLERVALEPVEQLQDEVRVDLSCLRGLLGDRDSVVEFVEPLGVRDAEVEALGGQRNALAAHDLHDLVHDVLLLLVRIVLGQAHEALVLHVVAHVLGLAHKLERELRHLELQARVEERAGRERARVHELGVAEQQHALHLLELVLALHLAHDVVDLGRREVERGRRDRQARADVAQVLGDLRHAALDLRVLDVAAEGARTSGDREGVERGALGEGAAAQQ